MTHPLRTTLDDPHVLAVRMPARDWPRRLLARQPVPDKWVALASWPDGRRKLVVAGQAPPDDDDATLLLVRRRPIEIELTVEDAPAADDHLCTATCRLILRWPENADELAALERTLLTDETLTAAGLARTVAEQGGRAALRAFVRSKPARELIESDVSAGLLEHLREALKPLSFRSGCVLERVAALEVASPGFRRQRRREHETRTRIEALRNRELIEQARLAAAERRLDAVRSLIDRLRDVADEAPGSWTQLVAALAPAERGTLLSELWRISPGRMQTQAIIAVTERDCVWLDPSQPERIARRVTLPPELGGLRSVQHDPRSNTLLVGSAIGVWVLDAETGEARRTLRVPDPPRVRTGFNAAVRVGPYVVATHSQLGCWWWLAEADGEPYTVQQPPAGPLIGIRSVQPLDDEHFVFASGEAVLRVHTDWPTPRLVTRVGSTIRSLAVFDGRAYIGTDDGRVLTVDPRADDATAEPLHAAGEPLESLVVRRWFDVLELLLPAGRSGVLAVYPEHGLTSRLLAAATPIRRVRAADDCVVALSRGYDRLSVRTPATPDSEGVTVPLAAMASSLIQDVNLVTRPREG